MAEPTSRAEFKERCLRFLGKPVIDIELDDTQVEDAIDIALSFYADYHFDGSDKTYYKILLTEEIITNKYITMPENIIGVVKIFPTGGIYATSNLFDARYQLVMSDLLMMGSVSLVPYYTTMLNIAQIEEILVGKQPIRYSRHTDRLYIDMNWDRVNVGSYLVAECYQVIDPTTYTDVWKDRWLMEYATAQIKKTWGSVLKKYQGIAMPGNVVFNGQVIYDEAISDIQRMERDMIQKYSLPIVDMIQ